MIKIDDLSQLEEVSVSEYNVKVINSIQHKYPDLRTLGKTPSFALQYGGTFNTLMSNSGFDIDTAKSLEESYHLLYKQSDAWVKAKIEQASKDGYVTLAFGLKLRTPLLAKTVLNSKHTLNVASAEARSAGNAVSGQSYGLLNNRAGVELMNRVYASKFKYDIRPVALIHDALYFVCTADPKVVEWLNTNLIECMAWQELPELQSDEINLEANLDIFYPDWANPITLKNNITEEELLEL